MLGSSSHTCLTGGFYLSNYAFAFTVGLFNNMMLYHFNVPVNGRSVLLSPDDVILASAPARYVSIFFSLKSTRQISVVWMVVEGSVGHYYVH